NGDANYTYIHHTQHDTIAEVVPEYQRASVRVIASAAWRIANLDERLPRNSIGGRNQRRARTHTLGVYLGEGLTIDDLVKGGLAEQAGMMAGDVILSVAGTAIATTSDLRKVLSDKTPQREVIWSRNGQKMKATFDWAEKKVSNAILF
ncbi:MAG: PDZ domain-containing protein, partial [Planctomycetota bacterium]|nr:PDZ domain-containing protein [Planctomycetota bacterium]